MKSVPSAAWHLHQTNQPGTFMTSSSFVVLLFLLFFWVRALKPLQGQKAAQERWGAALKDNKTKWLDSSR